MPDDEEYLWNSTQNVFWENLKTKTYNLKLGNFIEVLKQVKVEKNKSFVCLTFELVGNYIFMAVGHKTPHRDFKS